MELGTLGKKVNNKVDNSTRSELNRWCNIELCSKSACTEENLKMREEITVDMRDKTIRFSRQTMREEVFEKIFVSSGFLLIRLVGDVLNELFYVGNANIKLLISPR